MEYVDAPQLIIGHTFGHHHKLGIYGRHRIPYLCDKVKPVLLNDNSRNGMAVVRRITEHRRPCGKLVIDDAVSAIVMGLSGQREHPLSPHVTTEACPSVSPGRSVIVFVPRFADQRAVLAGHRDELSGVRPADET